MGTKDGKAAAGSRSSSYCSLDEEWENCESESEYRLNGSEALHAKRWKGGPMTQGPREAPPPPRPQSPTADGEKGPPTVAAALMSHAGLKAPQAPGGPSTQVRQAGSWDNGGVADLDKTWVVACVGVSECGSE